MDKKFIPTVFFFDSLHKIYKFINHDKFINKFYKPLHTSDKGLFRALSNISDEAFCETIFTIIYFCKMLHLRCLTGFWICLCLRLRSLKFYLFSRNTNYVIKSRLPYQFWRLFTVLIRTRSSGSTIAMPIIYDNHNNIKSWRSQERAFYLHVFILKIIVQNLGMFCDIWAKFQNFKKGLALTLFRSLLFQ